MVCVEIPLSTLASQANACLDMQSSEEADALSNSYLAGAAAALVWIANKGPTPAEQALLFRTSPNALQ